MKKCFKKYVWAIAIAGLTGCMQESDFRCERLFCEYVENPLGIDEAVPRFGWNLSARKRNQKQTAYELIVSDNESDIKEDRGNIWNTGRVVSSQNIQIEYEGKPLRSFTRYYWRVRAYDLEGKASDWSDIAWFETAMLDSADWQAKWIGDGSRTPEKDEDFYRKDRAPLFKKEFQVEKRVKQARLYITGLGYYEAYINGIRVGDHCLDPGWTTYSKRVLYATYDVSEFIRKGENAIGVMCGNGWYNLLPMYMWCSPNRNLRLYLDCGRPIVKAQLRVDYADGSSSLICSDSSWSVAPGPIVRNNVYLGEQYDARLEQTGWSEPGMDLNEAKTVEVVSGPTGRLSAQMQPPIRVIEEVKPVAVTEPKPGIYLVDMGKNFAGVVRARVKGKAGDSISFRYGEDIYPDGNLNGMTAVAGQMKGGYAGEGAPTIAWQEDRYILKGDPAGEIWSPRFTFHGFRYVEVTGWPGKLSPDAVTGLVLSADVPNVGEFRSSNEMFNTLQDNIRRSFRSNLFSVQSDCPAREKYGYGGDMFCTTEAFMYNYDMANFYTKVVEDHRDAQRPLGGITETAPFVGIADAGPGDGSGPLGFQLGYTYLVDRLYEFYGDIRIVREHYDALKKQADYLISCATEHLYNGGLSDHESLDARPFGLTESLFYYQHIKLMVKYAGLLNRPEDSSYYSAVARQVKRKVTETYYSPGTGIFDNATQTAQLFGLWHGLLSGEEEKRALAVLDSTFEVRDGHLSTGIFATKMMCDVLRLHDMNERMYQIADQREFPGWGYMVESGATSLWETWAYSDNVYSQNHPMFGSVGEWFYRSLSGINPVSPGFTKIMIKPQPSGNMTSATGRYRSIQGMIVCDWKITDGSIRMDVAIPVNTEAEVWVPASSSSSVRESGKPITAYPEIKLINEVPGYVVYAVGSGRYAFEAEYKK